MSLLSPSCHGVVSTSLNRLALCIVSSRLNVVTRNASRPLSMSSINLKASKNMFCTSQLNSGSVQICNRQVSSSLNKTSPAIVNPQPMYQPRPTPKVPLRVVEPPPNRPLDFSVISRLMLTLGCCGFLTGFGYFYWTQPSNSDVERKESLLFSEKSMVKASSLDRFLSKLEVLCDTVTDAMTDLLDKHVPLSNTPLLPDAADLKYPENLPTLVVDFDKVIVKMEHDRKTGWRVVKRPGADQFFKDLVYHYELVVWSDDSFPVAQEVCTKWGVPIVGALHRDQCKKRRGNYIKDLSRLGRRLERVLILDHDPTAFSLQPENGILIREFDGNPNDTDLITLTDFLKVAALSPDSDIRSVVKQYGGGDVDLVKRWVVYRSDQEKKSESRRSLGSRFFGHSPSHTPLGKASSGNTFSSTLRM